MQLSYQKMKAADGIHDFLQTQSRAWHSLFLAKYNATPNLSN